jgi:hypothetical protein
VTPEPPTANGCDGWNVTGADATFLGAARRFPKADTTTIATTKTDAYAVRVLLIIFLIFLLLDEAVLER